MRRGVKLVLGRMLVGKAARLALQQGRAQRAGAHGDVPVLSHQAAVTFKEGKSVAALRTAS